MERELPSLKASLALRVTLQCTDPLSENVRMAVGIDLELRHAREAKAAIRNIGTMRRETVVEILHRARIAARRAALPFSSEVPLNAARRKAGIALTILIPAFEAHLETSGRINKAKSAIDAWIKELEAAKP